MVKVDQNARVRRAHRDGFGIRALAKNRENLAMPPYVGLNLPPSILVLCHTSNDG